MCRHLSRPRRPFWGPLVSSLDFAGGAALQAVSECPLRRSAGISAVNDLTFGTQFFNFSWTYNFENYFRTINIRNNVGSKKILGSKCIFGLKKFLVWKKFLSEKLLSEKNLLSKKNFWSKKIFGQNFFFVWKLCPKQILVQKKSGNKKFWVWKKI